MGFLQNYLGLEPAYKDGYDLPLLGMMKTALHRDRPGADGFRSGHQGHAFRYHGVPEYAQRRGAVMSSDPSKIRVGPKPSRCVNLDLPRRPHSAYLPFDQTRGAVSVCIRPNRAAVEPGRAPRKRTFACAGRLGGHNYLTTRRLPDATWLSRNT